MSTLLGAQRARPAALVPLAIAAVATLVGGYLHASLFHRGYAEVDVVGPLFLLNGIGSLVVVLALIFDRVVLFVVGSLAIGIGSIVSILISHNASFFGFAEGTYDRRATIILAAEVVAVLFTVVGGLLALRRTAGADARAGVAA